MNSYTVPPTAAPGQKKPGSKPGTKLVWCLAVAMCMASLVAHQLRPRLLLADTRGSASIASLVPQAFGDWREVKTAQGVVNPQSQQLIDTLYTEVLNRTYRNAAGDLVMLAIAYGRDQSDELQVHEPLVCYPAQGFKIARQWSEEVQTPRGRLPVHRLETSLGETRPEPVTYWITVGDEAVEPRPLDKKRKKFFYSLRGYIPDGLLFRISSIDGDTAHALGVQDRFVRDLLAQLPAPTSRRLAGLPLSADGPVTP